MNVADSILYHDGVTHDVFNNSPSSACLDYFFYVDVEISNNHIPLDGNSFFDMLVSEWVFHKSIFSITDVEDLGSIKIDIYTSSVFPGQYLTIAYIKTSKIVKSADYMYIGHGQLTYNEKKARFLHFIIVHPLSNTYYKMDIHFILFSMFDISDTVFHKYLEDTFRTKVQIQFKKMECVLSSLSYENEWENLLDDIIDIPPSATPLSSLQDIESIPTPVSFQIRVPPDDKHSMEFQYKLFSLSWHSIKRWTTVISFVYTPMFMYYSSDSITQLLDSDNKVYHKYTPLCKTYTLSEEDILNITSGSNVYVCNSKIMNYFKNIPISIIVTIVSTPVFEAYGLDISKVMRKHPNACHHIHQIMPNMPSIIPRYLFLDDMPAVKMFIFKYTVCDFVIKFERDALNAFPYSGRLVIDDAPSHVFTEITFTEKTDYILVHIPYEMIQPALVTKMVRFEYSILYSNCKNIQKTHFIVYPIDNTVGGKTVLPYSMKDFMHICSSSPLNVAIPWYTIHAPNCSPIQRNTSRPRNTKCYRYRSRKCSCCGDYIHIHKRDVSKYIIRETIDMLYASSSSSSSSSMPPPENKYNIEIIHKSCYKPSRILTKEEGMRYKIKHYEYIEAGDTKILETGFTQLFKSYKPPSSSGASHI